VAVGAVNAGRLTRTVEGAKGAEIKYVLDGQVMAATKISPAEFSDFHRKALATVHLTGDGQLGIEAPGWRIVWIGAGEEKVVYLAIDPQGRAMALEILSKSTYLDGHLTEGHYFSEVFAPRLSNVRWDTSSLFGHIFSGRIKPREYIYGDTLAGKGMRPPKRAFFVKHIIGRLSRAWTRFVVMPRYVDVRRFYRDTHEANVMIELIPLSNPEKKTHFLLPVPWLEEDGKLHWRYYRLTPIDVRMPFDIIRG
jgi:hypothetical protein